MRLDQICWSGLLKENCFLIISICIFIAFNIIPIERVIFSNSSLGREFKFQVKVFSYPKYEKSYQEFKAVYTDKDKRDWTLLILLPLGYQVDLDDKLTIFGEILSASKDFDLNRKISGRVLFPKLIRRDESYTCKKQISRLRRYLLSEISHNWHGSKAALLSGLLLGADFDYPERIKEEFKLTNTIHLIVVSGFNIGLIYRFVIRISAFTGRKQAYLLSFFPLLLYFYLVGTDNIPCLRAILMAMIAILAGILGRRVGFGQSWGLALFLILIDNPLAARDLSLQLSFLASMGLILLSLITKNRVLKYWYQEALLTNIICSLITFPVLAKMGNIPSLRGIIANVSVTPLIPFTMIIALITLGLGQIWPEVRFPFLILSDLALQTIMSLITLAAKY